MSICPIRHYSSAPKSSSQWIQTARAGFSIAHSRSHLFALALNRALATYWRKEVPTDSLGSPDFDKLAIQRSRLALDHSLETYRLGKSLRRKGFDVVNAMDEVFTVLV